MNASLTLARTYRLFIEMTAMTSLLNELFGEGNDLFTFIYFYLQSDHILAIKNHKRP